MQIKISVLIHGDRIMVTVGNGRPQAPPRRSEPLRITNTYRKEVISMVIGIDHGFYAIKGPHVVFPSGLAVYDYEPYTTQNVLQYGGKYYVCGTGRQALMKDKTANDNYYLLTMAALAQEIRHRKAEKQLEVVLAAGDRKSVV